MKDNFLEISDGRFINADDVYRIFHSN